MATSKRKCRFCGSYQRVDSMTLINGAAFCDMEHAIEYARSDKALAVVAKKREQEKREDLRKRKEALRNRGYYVKKAQEAFNAFIRERDHYKPCISCGARSLARFGGGEDSGHYRSRGSAPHLALSTFNACAQCKKCNRDLSGNTVEYRAGLIARYGVEYVERIEADQRPRKYNIEQLKRLAALFRRRTRHYKKLRDKRIAA